MPSVKILLRTSKVLKNGEYPIVLRVIKDRKAKFIYTGLSCAKSLWDFKANKPSKKHPNKFELDLFISSKMAEAQNVILELENNNKEYSSEHIKRKYRISNKKMTVFNFLDNIIEDLMKVNKIGNANVYKDCKRALSRYRKGVDLNFNDIDVSFLKKFERSFLERNVTGNSISVYMRSLRSVFNRAISEGYCKKELYPFDEYKISKLMTNTNKRALTREQIQKIIDMDLSQFPELIDAKNIFLFSFYNRGINFTDIAMLKKENIQNDRLHYVRAKTGKSYNIYLLEPAQVILDYYFDFFEQSKRGYIFPILDKRKHCTAIQIDNRIEKMNKIINKKLKIIGTKIDLKLPLTTYVARHSYATIMKRSGVPTSIISESLGHDSERTTQIYLDSFENEMLDNANKAILSLN